MSATFFFDGLLYSLCSQDVSATFRGGVWCGPAGMGAGDMGEWMVDLAAGAGAGVTGNVVAVMRRVGDGIQRRRGATGQWDRWKPGC